MTKITCYDFNIETACNNIQSEYHFVIWDIGVINEKLIKILWITFIWH